ncbi:MBL fold metallo-hydrolase, partial [bacterium]
MKLQNRKLLLCFLGFILLFCQLNQTKADNKTLTDVNGWFKIKQIAKKVWQIDDYGEDNIYLVEGENKALLIDTGLGVTDLKKIVETITPLPLIVVNTHGHPDHMGGNFQFTKVFAHPSDLGLIQYFSSKAYHQSTIENATKNNPELASSFIQSIDAYKETSIVPVKA